MPERGQYQFKDAVLACADGSRTILEIAREVGCGEGTVRDMIRRFGIPNKHSYKPAPSIADGVWNDETVAIVKKCYAKGLSASLIANEIFKETKRRVSRNAVIGKIHRLGLAPTGRQSPRKRKQHHKVLPGVAPSVPKKFIVQQTELVSVRDENEPESKNLRLDELTAHQCRWPHGTKDYVFCGHPIVPGTPYCAHHRARAYQPTRAKPKTQRHPADYQPTQSNIKEFEDA